MAFDQRNTIDLIGPPNVYNLSFKKTMNPVFRHSHAQPLRAESRT